MCYGDGVYGGVYVAAMHARSFTADTLEEILEAGRRAVPEGSLFRETIEDVHACYDKGLTWQEAWQYIEDKWGIPITVSTARISPSTSTPSSTPLMCS